jgi:hypothetical protein
MSLYLQLLALVRPWLQPVVNVTFTTGCSHGHTMPDAVDIVTWAPDDGWRYHPKHVQQFTDINKLYIVESCWIIIDIYSWCTDRWTWNITSFSSREILHIYLKPKVNQHSLHIPLLVSVLHNSSPVRNILYSPSTSILMLFYIYVKSFQSVSFPQNFPLKFCMHLLLKTLSKYYFSAKDYVSYP